MAAVAQWQSATLWMWMLWVRNPSAAPKNALIEGVFIFFSTEFKGTHFVTFEEYYSSTK